MWPAQALATAEDRDIGADLSGEVPKICDRRDLRRGIDNDRHTGLMCDGNDLLDRRAVATQPGSREPEHGGGSLADQVPQRVGIGVNVDQPRPGHACGIIVTIALGAVDEDLVAREGVGIRERTDERRVVSGHAGGDRETDPGGRAGTDERRLVLRHLRDARPNRRMKRVVIDELPGTLGHGLDDLRRHQRPAERCQRGGRVDNAPKTQLGMQVPRGGVPRYTDHGPMSSGVQLRGNGSIPSWFESQASTAS